MAAGMMAYIKPDSILVEILCNDLIDVTWHILRLQRNRPVMINVRYREAIVKLLVDELQSCDEFQAQTIAEQWFATQAGKDAVLAILASFHLDETSIEAEALKILGPELELWERMVSSLQERRDRTLDTLKKVQSSVAKRAKKISDSIIDAEKTVSRDPLDDHDEAAE